MSEKTLVILDPTLRRGFTSMPNNVLFAPDLSMAAKCLYAILLSFAWQEDECYPGQERLAQACGCHVNTVKKYLKELRDYKLISWKRQGLNRPNIYYIHNLSDVEKLKDTKALIKADSQALVNPESQERVNLESQALVDKEYSVNLVVVDRPQAGMINQRSAADEDSSVPKRIAKEKTLPYRLEVQSSGKDVSSDDSQEQASAQALQFTTKEICGTEIPVKFFQSLLQEYTETAIKEKLQLLGTARTEIKNIPGWLIISLKNDYKHQLGSGKIRNKKSSRKPENNSKISVEEALRKRELIKSLYVN